MTGGCEGLRVLGEAPLRPCAKSSNLERNSPGECIMIEPAGAKMLLPAKMRKPLPIAATSVRDIRARHGSGGEDRGAELGMQHRDRRDAERRVASCGIWSR